jgi:hypothetical protein
MRIGPLSVLSKHSGGGRTLASWHNLRSLTWRWIISHQWRQPGWVHPSKWVMYGSTHYGSGNGGERVLCIGPLALSFKWQSPMWVR